MPKKKKEEKGYSPWSSRPYRGSPYRGGRIYRESPYSGQTSDRQQEKALREKALILELGRIYRSLPPFLIEACLRAEDGSVRLTLSAVQALELLEDRAKRTFDEE